MGLSEVDSTQNAKLAELDVRTGMLERNMSTLAQAVTELTIVTTRHSTQVDNLVEASRNNLQAVEQQTKSITTMAINQKWIRSIGYTVLAAAGAVIILVIKSLLG